MPEHQQTQKSTESKSTVQKQTTPRIQAPVSHPMAIIQRARANPKSLTPADILQLQRTIGNRAVGRLLSEIRSSSTAQKAPVQRQEIPDEEKTCPSCMQRQEIPEEEEPLQGKMIGTIQRQEIPEEEELLQTKKENNTGMPDNLKAGVESLSGIDMSNVRVHYNSSKPAEVGALAYTQGTNIHVAPGQEMHLPHEAWHVVQQAQGRVQPTMQMKDGVPINDDEGLEHEADVMGEKTKANALQLKGEPDEDELLQGKFEPVQRQVSGEKELMQGEFSTVQRVTKLQVQQGPSCWLYVLEAVASAQKGIGTKYINIVMKAYPDSPEAVEHQKTLKLAGKDISKRAAALDLIANKMQDMMARLIEWREGKGGKRAQKLITRELVSRYARQKLGRDEMVSHLTFSDGSGEGTARVNDIIKEFEKAKTRAAKLSEITVKEIDDVNSLLNTAPAQIDKNQDPDDVHEALKVQDKPSYVSILKRFLPQKDELNKDPNSVDFTKRDLGTLNDSCHAILLDAYDDGRRIVTYKDPNYGNILFLVTSGQFQAMAGDGEIKLRPFFSSGKEKSRLAEVID